jgi:hypothetical protein
MQFGPNGITGDASEDPVATLIALSMAHKLNKSKKARKRLIFAMDMMCSALADSTPVDVVLVEPDQPTERAAS